MTELELKFIVPAHSLASLRQDLLARGAQRLRLRAHYFDTADMALARHRAALRLRLEGRHWVQTLKTAGAGAVHRLEHEVRVPGRPGQRPALDLARHAGTAAGAALAEALRSAATPTPPTLHELHATDVQRLHWLMEDAQGTRIEAALDTGHALAAGRRDAIQELELEHKGGPLAGLFTVAMACVQHGGLWQSTLTKAERGLRLHLGQTGPQATAHRPPAVPRAARPEAVVRAVLQGVLTPLLAQASELATEGHRADGAFSAVSLAWGEALARLATLLSALAAAGPNTAPDAALNTVQNTAAMANPAWLQTVHSLAARWRRLQGQPAALCTLVRGVELQLLCLQLQQWAHAEDATPAALPARRWPQQRAALVAAGLLQA